MLKQLITTLMLTFPARLPPLVAVVMTAAAKEEVRRSSVFLNLTKLQSA